VAAHEIRVDRKPLTEDQQRDLGLQYHVAFEKMLRGGDQDAWFILAGSMNVALMLAEMDYGAEFIPEIKAAMQALMRANYRAQETGQWSFDGDGINAMRTALAIHDQQCALATRSEIRAALVALGERVREGHFYSSEMEAA
jgi:hypothetical protein